MALSMTFAKPPTSPGPSLTTMATTVGAIAVGAAVLEAALLPGLALGAAAMFAPGIAAKRLPKLHRRMQSWLQPPAAPRRVPLTAPSRAAPAFATAPRRLLAALPHIHVGQAVAKTITFRVAVTTLDFAWNYAILGELTTAAGLSALNLAVGPFFYFLHEASWNYLESTERRKPGSSNLAIAILPPPQPGAPTPLVQFRGFKMNRALFKTIVYESLGATAEFTVNFVVVGDVVTAAIITAPFVLLGPFIYFAHEKAWDHFAARAKAAQQGSEAVLF